MQNLNISSELVVLLTAGACVLLVVILNVSNKLHKQRKEIDELRLKNTPPPVGEDNK